MQLTVGQDDDDDAYTAGKQAADTAMTDDAGLIYVFASSSYNLEAALSGVADAAGDVPIVGCSSTIEITRDGISRDSIAVGVLSGAVDAGVGIRTGLDEDSFTAGRTAIKEAMDDLSSDEVSPFAKRRSGSWRAVRDTYMNVFADPLHGVGADVLEGVNEFLGPGFSVTGEFAADAMDFERTHVFYNGEVHENAVVCCVVRTGMPVGSARRHGFRPTPNQYTVTASEHVEVRKVDDKSPEKVYADVFGPDKANDPGFLLMAPFGLKDEKEDEYRLRVALDVDEQGCYHCGASVPEGETVTLMMAEKGDLLDAAEDAAEQAVTDAGLQSDEVGGALLFSCVARDAIYDDPDLTNEEVSRVQSQVGDDTPILGLYGFGQIATSRGWAAFNEETMAIQVIGS